MATEILTPRLQLRLITDTDLEFVHYLHSLPETDEYNTLGIPADNAETKSILDGWMQEYATVPTQAYTFIIEVNETHKPIGLIAIRKGKPKYNIAEVWYKLDVAEWSKGYATEALQAIIKFGFNTLQLHRIEAGCAKENIGSVRTLEKAGMLREGTRRKTLPLKSGWADNYIYGILSEDII